MITLRLPIPPPACHPNKRPTRYDKIRAVREYRFSVALEARQVADPPLLQLAGVALDFHLSDGRTLRSDPDNLIAWAKPLYDGLTDAGVFGDDRQLIHLPPLKTRLAKGADPVVVVCVYEVAEVVDAFAAIVARLAKTG